MKEDIIDSGDELYIFAKRWKGRERTIGNIKNEEEKRERKRKKLEQNLKEETKVAPEPSPREESYTEQFFKEIGVDPSIVALVGKRRTHNSVFNFVDNTLGEPKQKPKSQYNLSLKRKDGLFKSIFGAVRQVMEQKRDKKWSAEELCDELNTKYVGRVIHGPGGETYQNFPLDSIKNSMAQKILTGHVKKEGELYFMSEENK